MDPTTAEVAKNTTLVGALIFAVVFIWRLYVSTQTRIDAKADQMQNRCDEERKDLTGRIRELEQRRADDAKAHSEIMASALNKSGDALLASSRALERHCDIEDKREGSGAHRTGG